MLTQTQLDARKAAADAYYAASLANMAMHSAAAAWTRKPSTATSTHYTNSVVAWSKAQTALREALDAERVALGPAIGRGYA